MLHRLSHSCFCLVRQPQSNIKTGFVSGAGAKSFEANFSVLPDQKYGNNQNDFDRLAFKRSDRNPHKGRHHDQCTHESGIEFRQHLRVEFHRMADGSRNDFGTYIAWRALPGSRFQRCSDRGHLAFATKIADRDNRKN